MALALIVSKERLTIVEAHQPPQVQHPPEEKEGEIEEKGKVVKEGQDSAVLYT